MVERNHDHHITPTQLIPACLRDQALNAAYRLVLSNCTKHTPSFTPEAIGCASFGHLHLAKGKCHPRLCKRILARFSFRFLLSAKKGENFCNRDVSGRQPPTLSTKSSLNSPARKPRHEISSLAPCKLPLYGTCRRPASGGHVPCLLQA